MKKERSERERLQDILDAIQLIWDYPVANDEEYRESEVKRWFYLKQIEIMGEAAWKVGEETRSRYPEVPWKKISGTRHRLVHDYWEVDWDLLLQILKTELRTLHRDITRVIHDADSC